MRVLEQRLTAQAVEADEAIERLCLQFRHVECELNEARRQLQTYMQGYQQNGTARQKETTTIVAAPNQMNYTHSQLMETMAQ